MAKQTTTAASTQVATLPSGRQSLVAKFAGKYGVEPEKMLSTLKATAFKTGKNDPEVTNEQMMALLVVSDQYGLNPFLKEIYAFPDGKGGIIPMIPVDGWVRIINERPELDAIEFQDAETAEGEVLAWIECSITRKDRIKPIRVREYMSECKRNTGPWQSHPRRMLRHKALIQAARVAFGFAGIYDPDEGERIREAIDVTPPGAKPKTTAPRAVGTAPETIEHPADEPESAPPNPETPETNDAEDAGARG
jgi:phage recombination protein Bet